MKTKKSERAAKYPALILGAALTFMLGISACHGGNSPENTGDSGTETIMQTSWAHSYSNISELDKSSDFIGLVEIIGELRFEEILPDGVAQKTEGVYTIPLTVYSAKVLDGIVSDSDTIEIVMTGKAGEVQIADDPLMSAGEKWFIFAAKNDDGTCTILGGPQGRFIYYRDSDTISSLKYSAYSRSELESEPGLQMTDLKLSEVKAEIAGLRSK
ncbi:MAG: hypothetical protein LBH95_02460 [Oscillospiraceae bacterium]|jgi:hypothetical protein|nr:hypothetical protein [Oscillospiraceae bacterium]